MLSSHVTPTRYARLKPVGALLSTQGFIQAAQRRNSTAPLNRRDTFNCSTV